MPATILRTAVTREPIRKADHPAAVVAIADTVDQYTLVFEGRRCGKCSGSGTIPRFGHVSRGRCFACDGAGGRYTPRGRAARAQFDHLCATLLPVPRDTIKAGDRIWYRYQTGAWCTVLAIATDDMTEHARETGLAAPDETYVSLHLQLDHPDVTGTRFGTVERTEQGYTVPRWDAERVAAIVNQVAAMPGAYLVQQPATEPNGS